MPSIVLFVRKLFNSLSHNFLQYIYISKSFSLQSPLSHRTCFSHFFVTTQVYFGKDGEKSVKPRRPYDSRDAADGVQLEFVCRRIGADGGAHLRYGMAVGDAESKKAGPNKNNTAELAPLSPRAMSTSE
jgi:hypothetical protein